MTMSSGNSGMTSSTSANRLSSEAKEGLLRAPDPGGNGARGARRRQGGTEAGMPARRFAAGAPGAKDRASHPEARRLPWAERRLAAALRRRRLSRAPRRLKPVGRIGPARKIRAFLGQPPAEALARPGDPALDRPDVYPESRGDLLVGLVEDGAHREDLAVAGLELLHGGLHGVDELVAGILLGRIGVRGRQEIREPGLAPFPHGRIERERRLPAPAEEVPVAVARQIDGDPVEPGRKGGIAPEPGEGRARASPWRPPRRR